MTRLKFRLLVWLEPGSARSAEAHNNCVNRILKDLQSPEISTIGLKVLTADGEKTMQFFDCNNAVALSNGPSRSIGYMGTICRSNMVGSLLPVTSRRDQDGSRTR